jgi:peptidoglycan hydrolase-like protein with peptidoglycan-binding domain
MSGELNFEAMPFETYEGFQTAAGSGGNEMEEEFGRRVSPRGASARTPGVMPRRSKVASVSRLRAPTKPPVRRPHVGLPKWPWGIAFEPYGAIASAYPIAPQPAGSEYMRWVQNSLNDVLGLRLQVHGIADSATRSAIRSFQQREGLPADGVVGPDTERALIAARGGGSPRDSAVSPGAPGPADAPQFDPVAPPEPPPTVPAGEFEFEGGDSKPTLDDARQITERAMVNDRVAAGERDPNALADVVFFRRHPERRGQRLGAGDHRLAAEWKVILRDIVLPALTRAPAPSAAGVKISDREVAATIKMAAKTIPRLGNITIEELLARHQAEAGGIPIEVLLAFIHFEAGNLFDDATAGKWSEKHKRYIPSFYELGVFQTPAGDHGCTNEAGVRTCRYRPPGRNVENSQFGKGWLRLAGTYPTESTWKDPTMQVRVGLWDLTSTAARVRADFTALFPSTQSEWFVRMAVLYAFAAGAGAARSFLRKYRNELLAKPESQRWEFLRGKSVGTSRFNPENVEKKMALAAKLRDLRRAAR